MIGREKVQFRAWLCKKFGLRETARRHVSGAHEGRGSHPRIRVHCLSDEGGCCVTSGRGEIEETQRSHQRLQATKDAVEPWHAALFLRSRTCMRSHFTRS